MNDLLSLSDYLAFFQSYCVFAMSPEESLWG